MNMKKIYYCPICGRELIKSEIEGYSFQCLHCDEDFTESEVIIKREEDLWKDMNSKKAVNTKWPWF